MAQPQAVIAATSFELLADHGSGSIILLDPGWDAAGAQAAGLHYLVEEGGSRHAWYSNGRPSGTRRVVDDAVLGAAALPDGRLAFVRASSDGTVLVEASQPGQGVAELWRSDAATRLRGLRLVGSSLVLELQHAEPADCDTDILVLEAPDYATATGQVTNSGCRAFGDWVSTRQAMYRIEQPNRVSDGRSYWLTRFRPEGATLETFPGPLPDGSWDYPHLLQASVDQVCGKELMDYGDFYSNSMYCLHDDGDSPALLVPDGGIGIRLLDFLYAFSIGSHFLTHGLRILEDGTEESPGALWTTPGSSSTITPLLAHDAHRCLADRSAPQLIEADDPNLIGNRQLWLSDGSAPGTTLQAHYPEDTANCTGAGAWRDDGRLALMVLDATLSYFDLASGTLSPTPEVPSALQSANGIEHVISLGGSFLLLQRSWIEYPAMLWVHHPGRIFADGMEL